MDDMDPARDRGRVSIRTVADYAAHIPRGGAVGQAVGGALAITQETDALRAVVHALNLQLWQAGGSKGNQPQPMPYPEGTAAMKAKQDRIQERARRFREKHKTE
ncbi:hypothetical protein [Paenarthrobacter sp. YJN-5]|uniref:hypothetical protein n=1 Tax=Paenarthrobacter sp. YJN-5 TaxID=2735316 RepID=UPI00187836AB|nr:hypothetical protein [Paenarthrobacter sp. YJN-5]QOT19737.1 hypothetical protein HMI59_24050 [Paenarthrobacter sp. YJN-5]